MEVNVKERLKLDVLKGELGRCEGQLKNLKKELSFYEKLSDTNFFKGLIIWMCRYPIFFLPLLSGGVFFLVVRSNKELIFFGMMIVFFYFFVSFSVYASERSSINLLRRIENLESSIEYSKEKLESLEKKIKNFERDEKV
ncbi:hypothetical protein [Enterococcus termitis]|uniref:Uncharacterized protein n=1 Tax=Enterococcus termitis TaxID=332950 RepID=A0A1E5GWW6_9ENTE|nr:hypothetical protein [Enterococcus termitis]OEG16800.1 hypothetical protein BCR25_04175 [Enterococcus termitis]OJG99511.1 hypothetical protein RV18_GL001579 [Enterococcus termitis]